MAGQAILEKELREQVRNLSRLFHWQFHFEWLAIHSPKGFPDLCLVRPPRIIFAELKTEKGKVSDSQQVWIALLKQCPGVECYVWRPSDFDRIAEILR